MSDLKELANHIQAIFYMGMIKDEYMETGKEVYSISDMCWLVNKEEDYKGSIKEMVESLVLGMNVLVKSGYLKPMSMGGEERVFYRISGKGKKIIEGKQSNKIYFGEERYPLFEYGKLYENYPLLPVEKAVPLGETVH